MAIDTVVAMLLAASASMGASVSQPATQPATLSANSLPAKAAPNGGNLNTGMLNPMIGALMSGILSGNQPAPAGTSKPPATAPAASANAHTK